MSELTRIALEFVGAFVVVMLIFSWQWGRISDHYSDIGKEWRAISKAWTDVKEAIARAQRQS